MSKIYLSELTTFPVKSLAGVHHKTSKVDHLGLLGDRLCMVIDHNGRFVSQRKLPKMALIKTEESKSHWTLTFEKQPSIVLPKIPTENHSIPVNIWKDNCSAILASSEVNQWLSDVLHSDVRLVYYDYKVPRTCDPHYSKRDDIVSFADGFPILLTSEASLADLNQRMNTPVPMNSFRPNLVIAGNKAFSEDNWRFFKIGNLLFESVKPCARCILTTVDPSTGIRRDNREPFKTLSTYRKFDDKILFGVNIIPRSSGVLSVGDEITLLD